MVNFLSAFCVSKLYFDAAAAAAADDDDDSVSGGLT